MAKVESCSIEVGIITEFRRSEEGVCLEWRIPHSLELYGNAWYRSPDFTFSEACWYVSLYPGMHSTELDLIRLLRSGSGPAAVLKVVIGLRGSKSITKQVEVFPNRDACVVSHVYQRSMLQRDRYGLLPGFTLTITCEILILGFTIVVPSLQDSSFQTDDECEESGSAGSQVVPKDADASTQTDAELKEAVLNVDKIVSSKKQDTEKVLEDIGRLLISGKSSDITVQVKETEFKVHSAILCARSPVLWSMLEHQTAESASRRIVIKDCDPDVFEQYLRYLYTGSFQSQQTTGAEAADNSPLQQAAFGLYRIADKYLADDLKLLCLEHIRDSLCVRTFCDTLELALTHGESDLLQLAIGFASRNFQSIVVSIEWQNYICDYPREANEILVKLFGPQR